MVDPDAGFAESRIVERLVDLIEQRSTIIRKQMRLGTVAEAEIRTIQSAGRIKLGSLLADIGKQAGGFDLVREQDQASEPLSFE